MENNPEIKESTKIVDETLLMKYEHQVRILDDVLKEYKISPFGGKPTVVKEIVKGEKDLMDCLYSIGQHITSTKTIKDNQESQQNDSNEYIEGDETYKYEYIGEESDTLPYHKGDIIEINANIKCYYQDDFRFELTITKTEKNSSQENTHAEEYVILDNKIDLISMSNKTLTKDDKSKGKNASHIYEVGFSPKGIHRERSRIEENFIKSMFTYTDYKNIDPVDKDNSAFSKFLKGPTYVNFHNRGNGPKTGTVYKSICFSDIEGVSTCEFEKIKSYNDGSIMYVYEFWFDNKGVVFSLYDNNKEHDNNRECSVEIKADEDITIPLEIRAKLKDKVEKAKKWNCKLAMSSNISSLFYENTIEQVSPNLG